ncbi:hypothetical protein [Amycolatopsis kentuckyensis]|uniref:hypothetical protein n=1 Tax=Amycolatopsis kentuckyensis TaxID=218823 RepID=UPI003563FF3C
MTSSLIDASGAEQPALWEVAELPAAPAPTEQHVTRSAWPAYRALYLIGRGHLVLRVNIFTGRAHLQDPQCDLSDTRKRTDRVDGFFGRTEERAARAFAANKQYVVFDHMRNHRFGKVWLRGRRLKLTPAGEQLLARWARLQDPARIADDRFDAAVAALDVTYPRKSTRSGTGARVIDLDSRRRRP